LSSRSSLSSNCCEPTSSYTCAAVKKPPRGVLNGSSPRGRVLLVFVASTLGGPPLGGISLGIGSSPPLGSSSPLSSSPLIVSNPLLGPRVPVDSSPLIGSTPLGAIGSGVGSRSGALRICAGSTGRPSNALGIGRLFGSGDRRVRTTNRSMAPALSGSSRSVRCCCRSTLRGGENGVGGMPKPLRGGLSAGVRGNGAELPPSVHEWRGFTGVKEGREGEGIVMLRVVIGGRDEGLISAGGRIGEELSKAAVRRCLGEDGVFIMVIVHGFDSLESLRICSFSASTLSVNIVS